MSDKKPDAKPEGAHAEPAAASGGGMKAWLPLIITIVLMPVLAFVTTNFVIVPKITKVVHASEGDHAEGEAGTEEDHGAAKEEHGKPKAEQCERGRLGHLRLKIAVSAHIRGRKVLEEEPGAIGVGMKLVRIIRLGSAEPSEIESRRASGRGYIAADEIR